MGEITGRADSVGATSTCVWTIEVQPVLYQIRIVKQGLVVPTDPPTDDVAVVSGAYSTSTSLVVQVQAVSGSNLTSPVPNETVTFQFATAIPGAALGPPNSAQTNASGSASIPLALGSTTGAYQIIAQIPQGAYATFKVNVTKTLPLQSSSDCGSGFVCQSGHCQPISSVQPGCTGFGDQGCRSDTNAVRTRVPASQSAPPV